MTNDYVDSTAREDFNKARAQVFFSRILNLFTPSRQELLSLNEVRAFLRPRGETYQGMRAVAVDAIVGSEGRYQDFNKKFLPKHEYLRGRWESIDRAHLTDIILPPIKLYKLGGAYFVRDGNHRVSVAKTQGVISVDAEVVTLDTEIPLHGSPTGKGPTRAGLKRAVIEHEKNLFNQRLKFDRILEYDLNFSATGRYDEIEKHILGHKYFLNEHQTIEIPLEHAMQSWFSNVFEPVIDVIEEQHLMTRFPGRTSADLYLWIVRHWDALKHRYGLDFPVKTAAEDYSRKYGTGFWARVGNLFGFSGKSESDG